MDYSFSETIRVLELELIKNHFNKGAKLLEIGSGAGWQAKKLSESGFDVEGIDITQENDLNYNYENERVWNIKIYDGFKIPFPDKSFDGVFSSNVLEHIPHVQDFQKEIKRVLKNDGVSVHILPSFSWRFWTSITFYLVRVKKILLPNSSPEKQDQNVGGGRIKNSPSSFKKFFPPRHGERGSLFTEFYLFTAYAWKRLFEQSEWQIGAIYSNRIFYTGEQFLGKSLSINARNKLSFILGGACNVFLLKKKTSE